MNSRISLDKRKKRQLLFPILFLSAGLILALIYHIVFPSREAGLDGILFYLCLSSVSFILMILFQRFIDNRILHLTMSMGWGLVFLGTFEKLIADLVDTAGLENENFFSAIIFFGLILIAIGLYMWTREMYLQEKIREQQHRVIGLYTSLMSHDAGNDLQAVLGYVEAVLLMCKDCGPKPREMLEAAQAATLRMTSLLQAFKTETITSNMPLGPLIQEVTTRAEKMHLGIVIHTNIETKNERLVIAGGPLFQMALANIIRNAVEHGSSNPVVEIVVKRESNTVILLLSDNGPGIPSNLSEQLFIRSKTTGDHGIGLYLTHQIVSACGGSIQLLESDNGTLFEIKLPLVG